MDIAKIKAKAPTLDPKMLMYKCHGIRFYITKIISNTDIKALIIGSIIVLAIYALIFIYVFASSSNTTKLLQNNLATEIYPINYVKHSEIEQINNQVTTVTTEAVIDPPEVVEGLYEHTKDGNIPIIRKSDNLTSFRAYQHKFTFPENNKPIISFVILDYGLSKEQSKTALDLLPSEVSFILSPYAVLPDEWVKMAQDKGHEVLLNVPIQNNTSNDLGKHTIFHHATLVQKLKSLRRTLSSAQGYIGMSSYSDDSMMITKDHYIGIADELYSRGLGYFEINPNATNIIKNKAFSMGAPYIKADLKVINIKGNNSFETLENIANNNGHAIAIIPNYPKTIKNLAVWIMKVAQADYVIAPVSAIYDLPVQQRKYGHDIK